MSKSRPRSDVQLDLAGRVVDLRVSVELAKPLIRMVMLRPVLAETLLPIALGHLEDSDRLERIRTCSDV